MTTVKIFPDINAIAGELAELLFGLASTPGKQPIHIALSGGNTPKLIFNYLAETYGTKLANKRFHFWWGDERCVPPADDECNYKWTYELWLKPIGIAFENIHRIEGERMPEEEAIRYSQQISHWLPVSNSIPRFDLNLLGLGDDGHTASIFPTNMELLHSENWCEVASHPITGQKRVTLTGRVINNSSAIVFVATGSGKAQMIKNVAIDSKSEFPASHIHPSSGEAIWLIDNDAAGLI